MRLNATQMYKKIKPEKIVFPMGNLWTLFLKEHNNGNTQKSAKALFHLVESLFRYTTLLFVIDYLGDLKKHNKDTHLSTHKSITQKRNWMKNWFCSLKDTWPQKNTFFTSLVSLNSKEIIESFSGILQPEITAGKKHKNISTKEYRNQLKFFEKLIPLMNAWSNYSLVYYQDFPWEAEKIVPVLSFVGSKPETSLHKISSKFYGTMGKFYLSDGEKSLALFPFFQLDFFNKTLSFFAHYHIKKQHVEYVNYSLKTKGKVKFPKIQREFLAICQFLEHIPLHSNYQNIEDLEVFDRDIFYQPLNKVSNYYEIDKKIKKSLKKKSSGILTSLTQRLSKFFINIFLEKLLSPEVLQILVKVGYSQKLLCLNKNNSELANFFLEILLHSKETLPISDSLFNILYEEFIKKHNYDAIKELMKVWVLRNQKDTIAQIKKIDPEYKEDVFLVVLDFLLEENYFAEAISFFEDLYDKKNMLFNKNTISKLIKAFIKIKPGKSFEIIYLFIHSWDIEWIDDVINELIEISLDKTINFINNYGFHEKDTFDSIKWKKWLKIFYILLEKNDSIIVNEFVFKMDEKVSHLRLKGACALLKNDIDSFFQILSEVSFTNNIEHIIGSTCFFIRFLPADNHELLEKLIKFIQTYSHSLLDFSGEHYIKQSNQKFLANIDAAEIISIQKKLESDSLFSVYVSYLIAQGFLSGKKLKEDAIVIKNNFLKNSSFAEDLFDFSNKEEEYINYEHNTVNQLLTEIASVLWDKKRKLAIHYILQIIPDTLFDKEDSIKKLITCHPNILLKDLDLFQLDNSEKERVEIFWLENHIHHFPQNILFLYAKGNDLFKGQLIVNGLPLLINFNMQEAVKFFHMIKNEAIFDFGKKTGEIFLKFYRYNEAYGEEFLLNLNGWDLVNNLNVSSSLLKNLKKLPLKKLTLIYKHLIGNLDNLYKEDICTLVLLAIVNRKPSFTFSFLEDLHFSPGAIEKILYSLISELSNTKQTLAHNLSEYLYQKMQTKKFTIDINSLEIIENSIISCLKQEESWYFTPEVAMQRWMFSPSLFGKLCHELFLRNPERAISLSHYLVGKKEYFLLLGEPPLELIANFSFDTLLSFSNNNFFKIKYTHKKDILHMATLTIQRLPIASIEIIFPYLLHPMWKKNDIFKFLKTLPLDVESDLSLSNYLILIVLREINGFERLRFEKNIGYISTRFHEDMENIDVEKHFLPTLLRIMFWIDKNLIEEIWSAYWDQQDFMALAFINAIDSIQDQIKWIEKIISLDDRLDGLEIIALNIVEENFPNINGFLDVCMNLIKEFDGLERIYFRIPNIFIFIIETNIEKAIALIDSISSKEILNSAVEFTLEYLGTSDNISKKSCKEIVSWLKNSSITRYTPANELIYFYCQLTERMLDIKCDSEVRKMIAEIVQLSEMCQEREKRYYLEDLVIVLIDNNLDLAYKVVQSYEDNELQFVEIIKKLCHQNLKTAIKRAKNHHNSIVVEKALNEIICEVIAHENLGNWEYLLPNNPVLTNSILHALVLSLVKKGQAPEKYISQIENDNELVKVYCDIAEIYLKNKNIDKYLFYKEKIKATINTLKPSHHFLGLSLEWSSGFLVEIPIKTLTKLSYLYPESVLTLFYLYLKHDRFLDIEEILQAIFRGITFHSPDKILDILKQMDNFDMSSFQDVLVEQAKVNPKRAMNWLAEVEQTELYTIVLDQIKNKNTLKECLEVALEHNNTLSKQDYIDRLSTLAKYLFRLGNQAIIFEMMEIIKLFSPPPFPASIKEIVRECTNLCRQWEKKGTDRE